MRRQNRKGNGPTQGAKRKGKWTLPRATTGVLLVFEPGLLVSSPCQLHIGAYQERQRTDAFELWCWRRLLRVPWTARISNQSIRKEISPEYSLEGLMLKLKLHYFGHLIRRTDLLEKVMMLEKIEGQRRRGQQRMRW